jgi:hypothetical protein
VPLAHLLHIQDRPLVLLVGLAERLRTLVASNDRAGTFLWKLFGDYVLYAAEMIPEIADRIVDDDRAMRWGYAHKFGPFELWDALGFRDVARRLEKEGRALPVNIQKMIASGATSLYRTGDGRPHTEYFDFRKNGYEALEPAPGGLTVEEELPPAAPIRRQISEPCIRSRRRARPLHADDLNGGLARAGPSQLLAGEPLDPRVALEVGQLRREPAVLQDQVVGRDPPGREGARGLTVMAARPPRSEPC